jgi:hypothetical protein
MSHLSRILVPVAAMATIALAIPAMANATDYCVQTSCGGTNVNDLQAALDEAKKSTDADRVFLGAGVQMAQSSFGFKYDGAGPVEIVGAGENNTVLTAPLGATAVLTLKGGVGSSVHDLAINLPQYSNGDGLYTSNAARRLYVGEAVDQSHLRHGVTLISGGSLEDSEGAARARPEHHRGGARPRWGDRSSLDRECRHRRAESLWKRHDRGVVRDGV